MTGAKQFSFDPSEFAGKRALVTGGTKGIGSAIARRLVAGGATVVTTARTAARERDPRELFFAADLTTRDGAETVLGEVKSRLGGVDILVHNLGGSSAPSGGVLALTDEDWQDALGINLMAAVRLEQPSSAVRQPPQCAAEVAGGVALGGIRPEHPRDVGTQQRTIAKCQEREEALCRQREERAWERRRGRSAKRSCCWCRSRWRRGSCSLRCWRGWKKRATTKSRWCWR